MQTNSTCRRLTRWVGLLGCVVSLALIPLSGLTTSSAGDLDETVQAQATPPPSVRLRSKHLANLLVVHPKVLSGGTPNGEGAFDELKRRGVRTIISVDAETPDAELARQFGIRYVHLPIGYAGIDEDQQTRLGKAFRELPGGIYVHCHHGEHRGPTAAAVGCVVAGMIPPDRAIEVMRLAGTSERYSGLYSSARRAQPTNAQTLRDFEAEFREAEPVPTLASIMSSMTESYEQIESAVDRSDDQDAAVYQAAHREAVLLEESFAELSRLDGERIKEADFVRLLKESQSQARRIERLIEARGRARGGEWRLECAELVTRLGRNCTACHAKYRDVDPGRLVPSKQASNDDAALDDTISSSD